MDGERTRKWNTGVWGNIGGASDQVGGEPIPSCRIDFATLVVGIARRRHWRAGMIRIVVS
jgi:hypothetical protein